MPNNHSQLLKKIEKNLSKKNIRDVDSQFFELYIWRKITSDLIDSLNQKINDQN